MMGMNDQELMASSTALKGAKKELRSLMKAKLAEISQEPISSQSNSHQPLFPNILIISGDTVFKSIQNFKPYQESKRIGIYLSMPGGEIQTDPIVRHALSVGKKVFVPYLHKLQNPPPDAPKSVMDMVDLRSLMDYETLKRDSWRIPTIDAGTVDEREHVLTNGSEKLDLVLMPGVAFDVDPKSGFIRRLGHGKGFYDYFLHRYREGQSSQIKEPSETPGTDVLLYGLALEEQYLNSGTGVSIPVGEHDSLLHGLLLGNGKTLVGPISAK
jgi:5-formyltetrahydrofolate cyclo-ligase